MNGDTKKILFLTIKRRWFDMIASGEKKEEYREVKMYWATRLQNGFPSTYGIDTVNPDWKDYDVVRFASGGSFHKSIPQVDVKFIATRIGTGKPEWGAEPGKEYFVIKLGEIIKPQTP